MCIAYGVERYVVGTIFGRCAVGCGIDAEHAEVACLSWPHPVVGVAAEFAQTLWWCKHKAHVVVALIYRQVVFAAAVVGGHFAVYALHGVEHFGMNHLCDTVDFQCFHLLVHIGIDAREHAFAHVFGTQVESHIEFGVGQFVLQPFGHKSVFQVVVTSGRVFLYGIESAVVVCKHESVGAHHDSRAETAEHDYGSVERWPVGVVELFGCQFKSHLVEVVPCVSRHVANHPHSFIGTCEHRCYAHSR